VRLVWHQPIFGNPVEPVRKLNSTSKLAKKIYRIFQLVTVPALARTDCPVERGGGSSTR
jgi:hypothetical protein